MPIMNPQGKVLGILVPVGGGDPIPLTKPEIIVGRRRSCDLFLDFNNISGKHCQLRIINGVWHARDLGSTNGTSLNGMALNSEHSVLPDDELGIASHLFTIDYEPSGPDALLHMQGIEEEGEDGQTARRHSILELAGIEGDEERPRRRSSAASSASMSSADAPAPAPAPAPPVPGKAPAPGPGQPPARKGLTAQSDFGDEIPENFVPGSAAKPAAGASASAGAGASQEDDDFFKIFEEDVKRAGDQREKRK
jgi:hypothetical protein